MLSQDERSLLKLAVETLEKISAKLTDIQTQADLTFHMTEKHQTEVKSLLQKIVETRS